MPPSVSVGIPTYNRSSLLSQAIHSVLRQTHQDFEIVVSDDCSPDDTADVVQSFKDTRIKYHRTAVNLRPPRNWNECARRATGEFFVLLPDDDIYLPGFIEAMVTALRQHPEAGFAQCGFYSVDESLRPLRACLAHPSSLTLSGEEALLWQMENLCCIPASVMFRRTALEKVGYWREDYWDDWAFMVRVAYRHGFTFVPQVLSANRVHGQNLNRALYREQRDAVLDLINQQADVFGEALPTTPALLALRAKLDRRLSQHCMLLALGAVRRREWAKARFHATRARHLYALAWLDPGFIKLWLSIRAEIRRAQAQRSLARQKPPVFAEGISP